MSRVPGVGCRGAGFPWSRARWARQVLLAALVAPACSNTGEDRVLSIEATGTVAGLVFLDGNGNGEFAGAADAPFEGIGVRLLAAGSLREVATTTSDDEGLYTFGEVGIGSYVVAVDAGTLGDTLVVGGIDAADVTLSPGDSADVRVAVTYPSVTAAEARTLAPGARVFVVGVALNGRGTFGDSTVHTQDSTGALRLTGVVTAVAVGDSARFLGRRAARDGQATLDSVTSFPLGDGTLPAPALLSTAGAATAEGGQRDAALVLVQGASITDTTTSGEGDYVLTVDDGTGLLRVILDQDVTFPLQRSRFIPGEVIDATGLLVPTGTGLPWALKPRANADLVVN